MPRFLGTALASQRRMLAAVLQAPGVMSIVERPIPATGPDDVLVRVSAVGICGSDVHYYTHGRIGRHVLDRPIILGHEAAGDIAAVGTHVSEQRVGERVAIEPGIPCRACAWCASGRYNLCPQIRFLATPPVDGAFVEFLAIPSVLAHAIPPELSLEAAALVEPTAVGVHAARTAEIRPGTRCAVIGCGPIGLLLVQVLRAHGASYVAAADPDPDRRQMAAELGADEIAGTATDFQASGHHAVFEASGSAAGLATSIGLARPGGRVVWIGLPRTDEVPVAVSQIIDKELVACGVFRYANAHALAIDLIARGQVRTGSLITHRFPLQRAGDALDVAASRSGGVVKVLVEPATQLGAAA
jgi:L-iditol 2-dehydrogenase